MKVHVCFKPSAIRVPHDTPQDSLYCHLKSLASLHTARQLQMARYISIQIKATSDYLAIQDVKVKANEMKAITATAWASFLLWAWASRASGSYYRATDYPLRCYVTPQLVSAKSEIGCASRCTMTRCSYFRFLDETCTLFDQGLASETTSRTYRKVNSTLLDVALNKPTSPSTHYSYLSSDRAVDGDLVTQYYSVDKNNPWWRVDLGQNYCIQLIDIHLPRSSKLVPFR
ncbi:uncharacterized protein LOC122260917 [Penaeus japonicus]|uniref:uncharacterized protein LOC122260917 n=1 Tax=Penaeus japonicus TaxID=27405 RepID=UPI001C710DB8|nr:uncharacterized protein LOC122260917 [Penaeus japonicus]